MKFDPLFNYGDLDLTIEENLILWKFGELIKTLVTLASNAKKQIEIIGIGRAANEMAEDFHNYFTLSYQPYIKNKLMTNDQKDKLMELDKFFDDRNGDISPEFWSDFKLHTNSEWNLVRQRVKKILNSMNMDDLTLDLKREEKYEMTNKGKEFVLQTTKTKLIKISNS